MQHLISISKFKEDINEMRNAIHDNLLALMEQYKQREVDCTMFDDCPIVSCSIDDNIMTLDSIEVITAPSTKCIQFNCSNSWTNDYITPNYMDIEYLVDLYEWVIANEEELFNNED